MNSMEAKLRQIPGYGALALLVYMPFHVFISQWFSSITGGLELWKGAKDFATFLLLIISFALVTIYVKTVPKAYYYLVGGSLLFGFIHLVLYAFNRETSLEVAGLATAYNCRLFAYLIVGYSATLLTPELVKPKRLIKWAIIVSTIVCALGILQYVLPKDVMTHFGYSVARGVKPAFFIDDKPDLPRIMSTLRDPNSLAAFLLVPLTIIWAYLLQSKNKDRRMLLGGLFLLHGLAILLTFSRAGWAGAFISLTFITVVKKKQWLTKQLSKHWPYVVAIILILAFGAFMLRDQYFVQNVLFHSDENTKQTGSTSLHAQKIQEGLDGIVARPQGHGPGTAGLVSTKNPDGGLLPENFYVQIGYELGILGLALFIWLNIYVYLRLKESSSPISAELMACFWAYVLINMLLQIWSNEAVAVQWWLLAGVALEPLVRNSHNKTKRPKLL